MSDEQWTWQPLGAMDGSAMVRCACGNPSCRNYVAVDDRELYAARPMGDGGDVELYLPDDVRLCRRVLAPPKEKLPDEIRETLHAALIDFWDGRQWRYETQPDVDAALAWLDAQPRQPISVSALSDR